MQSNDARWGSVRWLPVINIDGEDAPSWGVLEIVKTRVINEQTVFEIQKPTADELRRVMFNDPAVIKAGKQGWATLDFPCQVLCESDVAAGDTLHVKSGQWDLEKAIDSTSFYICLGDGGADSTRYIDSYQKAHVYPFELTTTLTHKGSANAKRLLWNATSDTYAVTGDAFPVFDNLHLTTLGANSGDRGLCYDADDLHAIVVNIATDARWIEFTVTSALLEATTSQSCAVVQFHDGEDPGTPQTVHFDLAFAADAGAPGIAMLGNDGNYHCVNINCPGA